VDRAFLFRVMAKELAHRHGLLMTFMGRPFSDRAGSGMHVNVSLADESGTNAFADRSRDDGLADVARHCIAGLVEHHVGMTALCAPTVNAYKRLRPGFLSGYWANWGYDHRGVSNRVPPHRGEGTRIENRLPDGAANPYLAATAILHAARLGVAGALTPPPFETADGVAPASTDVHAPEDLAAALTALEADTALVDAVGGELVANFVGIKRAEWERFTAAVTDWELKEYLWFC
jgi:glutamine synthetase